VEIYRDASGLREHRWACIFSGIAGSDPAPVLTISRTSKRYTVVIWDILAYFINGEFSSCSVPTISEALQIIKEIATQVAYLDRMSDASGNPISSFPPEHLTA
jgi:hypothetical protein